MGWNYLFLDFMGNHQIKNHFRLIVDKCFSNEL